MKTIIRVLLTGAWLIWFIPATILIQVYNEDVIRYEFAKPESKMVRELETALAVTFPEDLKVTMIAKGFTGWSVDQTVEIRVYSNYGSDEWEQLLGGNWERSIGSRNTELIYHKTILPQSDGEKGYLSFRTVAKEIFNDADYRDATKKNDTLFQLMTIWGTLLYIALLVLVWLPYGAIMDHILDPTGEKRMKNAGFKIPDWVKEEEEKQSVTNK